MTPPPVPSWLVTLARAYRETHDWLVWIGRDRSATSGRVKLTVPPQTEESKNGD